MKRLLFKAEKDRKQSTKSSIHQNKSFTHKVSETAFVNLGFFENLIMIGG